MSRFAAKTSGTGGSSSALLDLANQWKADQTIVQVPGSPGTTNVMLIIDSEAGTNLHRRSVRYTTAGVIRWALDADNAAESGSNAGSYFGLNRYDDAGSYLSNIFAVDRSNGDVTFLPSVNANNANAKFSIGTSQANAVGNRLTVTGALGNAILAESTTSTANVATTFNAVKARSTASGGTASGFGVQTVFEHKDSAGLVTAAVCSAVRRAGRTTTDFLIQTNNAGTLGTALTVSSRKNILVGAAGEPTSAVGSIALPAATVPTAAPSTGSVVYSDGSTLKTWGAGASGPTSLGPTPISTKTASYTATFADKIILANGSGITITLPSATANSGREYVVKNIGTSSVTITSSAGTIDGAATLSLATQNQSVTVISDGNNWYVI